MSNHTEEWREIVDQFCVKILRRTDDPNWTKETAASQFHQIGDLIAHGADNQVAQALAPDEAAKLFHIEGQPADAVIRYKKWFRERNGANLQRRQERR